MLHIVSHNLDLSDCVLMIRFRLNTDFKTVIRALSFIKSLKTIIRLVRSGYLSSSSFGVPNFGGFF